MALHPSIRIEGGLLGPDLLDQLRAGELPGQKPADFAVRSPSPPAANPAGRPDPVREKRPVYGGEPPRPRRRLTDEVARAFAGARSLWSVFQHRRERLPAGDPGTSMTPAASSNQALRERVEADADSGVRIAERDLYRQLLVLVYRFLFLLVAEDRGLIGASPLYRAHYGVGRLRTLLDRPASEVDHDDLWQSLRVVWRVLAADRPEAALDGRPPAALLGLPVLNGDLFTPGPFDGATIANRHLIRAFDHLARYEEGGSARRPTQSFRSPRRRRGQAGKCSLSIASSMPPVASWRIRLFSPWSCW